MPSPSIEHRPIFHACIANAVRESKLLIGTLVEATRTALAQEEAECRDLAQRALIGEALRKLQAHEQDLIQSYPKALRYIVSQGALPSGQPRNSAMGLNELTLVDDDDIMAEVEMSRTQQLATQLAEIPLSELDTLVSAAQGLESVQPKSNPLRPENYIRALQQVVGSTGVSAQVRQFWMRHMRERLGTMLADTYQRTADHLRQQGVVPVGYVVVAPAGSVRRSSGGATAPYDQSVSSQHTMQGAPVAAGYPMGGHIAHHVPTVAAVGVMEDITQIDQLVARLPAAATHIGALEGDTAIMAFDSATHVMVAAPPPPALAPRAVLRQMMENIAQNTQLLAAVRQAILRLEPALGQLVDCDAQFFTDAKHPARRLLDELTQRSLAFTGEASPEFQRFMRVVAEVVDYLAVVDIHDAAPFAQVLLALEKVWRTPLTAPPPNPDERRKQLARQFSAEFAAYPETEELPEDWLAFIVGPWAEVVALARDTHPALDDPGGYHTLMPLLLRCADSEALSTDPDGMGTALAEAAPVVRQGLESISASAQYIDYILQRLAQWQQQAQEYAAMRAQEQAISDEDAHWKLSQEPLDSIHASGHPHSAHLSSSQQAPAKAPTSAKAHPIPSIGQWVDIANDQRVLRTQLTWHSPNQMIFMFTSKDGSTLSMTRRTMDRLAAQGAFTPLQRQ